MPWGRDGETHFRQLRGNIEVGHQKPLVTRLALAVVLALLVNEQDHHLSGCPRNRVHLTCGIIQRSWGLDLRANVCGGEITPCALFVIES